MFQSFTGRQYLMIDIANGYGLDKQSWDHRLEWFNTNQHQLDALVQSADEPALFYAAVQAWKKVEAGEPIGYMVSLDATSSGLQLLACLTGDRKAASICNVIDTGERADAYTIIYNRMVQEIGEAAKIERDDTKQAIMTAMYGSTAMPKLIFGETGPLINAFYGTMKESAPLAWELNEAFLAMWRPDALINSWVMPDNFHVHVKVMDTVTETVHFANMPVDVHYKVNRPTEEGRSLGANTIHSIDGMIVRELVRRCDYDPMNVQRVRNLLDHSNGSSVMKETLSEDDNMVVTLWDHYNRTGYLSARILDHIDFDNIGYVDASAIEALLESLPKKPFKVLSIHQWWI